MRVRLLAAIAVAGCEPALDQRLAIVDSTRILAVISEPAEAKPGAQVGYSLIAGDRDGPLDASASWAYCLAPKPPTEDNTVSSQCFDDAQLRALADGTATTGTLPVDGCIRFGPDTPPGGFRPRDPDPTGGYFQPVRTDLLGDTAFGATRIICKLPRAPSDVALQYDREYIANQNPVLAPIELAEVAADTDVTLTASWPAASVESYLWFDPSSQRLVSRREAMRVSWFATGGALESDGSAVAEGDDDTSVSTTWHAPAPGSATLWFVLRDSRGGVAVQSRVLDVH